MRLRRLSHTNLAKVHGSFPRRNEAGGRRKRLLPKPLDQVAQVLQDLGTVSAKIVPQRSLLLEDINGEMEVVGVIRHLAAHKGEMVQQNDDGSVENGMCFLMEQRLPRAEVADPLAEEQVLSGSFNALTDHAVSQEAILWVRNSGPRQVSIGDGLLDGHEEDGSSRENDVLRESVSRGSKRVLSRPYLII